MVDTDALLKVPLNKEGINSPYYKIIAEKLKEIKKVNPSITYIYTMGKSKKEGIYKFIVDPNPGPEEPCGPTAYPGDEFNVSPYPAMQAAFNGPSADKGLQAEDWGVTLSGYAPILDNNGNAIAIIGVDMKADDIYAAQKEIKRRALIIFLAGACLSLIIGIVISGWVTNPIKIIVDGTRHIAKGDLRYRLHIRGNDEIAELAEAFNNMSSDLLTHIDKLKHTTAEKERMLKELEIAKGIQQSFLPDSAPDIKNINIAAATMPARVVGGDFYDFIPIGKDRWGIVIADVSGKGIPAALFMALTRTLIRASATANLSVVNAVKQANRLIFNDVRTNMFVTLFYAILSPGDLTLEYVNAGHNPPFLLKQGLHGVKFLKAGVAPLGLFEEIDISSETIKLEPSDLITLYTDGATEARGQEKKEFGIKRLVEEAKKYHSLTAREIITGIQQDLNSFAAGQPQFDDITLMAIKAF
jgi:HAMP domain-containing protein